MHVRRLSEVTARLSAALADRYRIERELGAGGMATVYLAQDLKHHRQVAIKVLKPELATALGPERFLREIDIAAQLAHPHILPLYDSGQANGFLYYVMPYVEGESLRDRLNREKQLPLGEALRIGREVADGLSHAHNLGVVHRDIKPENILLSGGHAVVSDFGIARAVTEAAGERLTETGLSLGTPAYMSPEQATAGDVDARSDVYSLGCVVYELLAGEPPHSGPTPQAVIAKRLSEPPQPIRSIRETIPPELEETLLTALARTPADRYATASQFAAALSVHTRGPEWMAQPTGPWRVAGLYVLSVIAVLGVMQFVLGLEDGRAADVDRQLVTLDSMAASLVAGDDSRRASSVRGLAQALRGYRTLSRGRRVEATRRLGEAARELPGYGAPAGYVQHLVRFDIGRLHLDAGEPGEAERYFQSFGSATGLFGRALTTPRELYLGQVYESLGELERARLHYANVVRWWEDADPELQSQRDQALQALTRLTREPRVP